MNKYKKLNNAKVFLPFQKTPILIGSVGKKPKNRYLSKNYHSKSSHFDWQPSLLLTLS